MVSLSSALNGGRGRSFKAAIFVTVSLLGALMVGSSRALGASGPCEEGCTKPLSLTAAGTVAHDDTDFVSMLRGVLDSEFTKISAFLAPKLLTANVRPGCSLALLRAALAFKKLEPWALRLFDATGKYPSGLFEWSRADMGAFDECIETEVRDNSGKVLSHGQYCNLQITVTNETALEGLLEYFENVFHPKVIEFKSFMTFLDDHQIRIGLCFLDDCTEEDLQSIVDTLMPSVLSAEVVNCVTAQPVPWSPTQIGIVTFLALIGIAVTCATSLDLVMLPNGKYVERRGILFGIVSVFSVAANTRVLLRAADEASPGHYSLRFLHGIRFFSMAQIVLGHCYTVPSDIWARSLNLIIYTGCWPSMFIAAGMGGVDTFFFMSGFFLALATTKLNRNAIVVFFIAVLRRLIRTCIPLFFVIMCVYVLPRFVTGPNVKEVFAWFYGEIARDWWRLLSQIKNFSETTPKDVLAHAWYLSADFQLLVTSLLVLLILKSRKTLMLGAFAVLSLVGCAVSAWTASDSEIMPFMIVPGHTPSSTMKTIHLYYARPFYHAVCYFSGCMTLLLLDDFRKWPISRGVQLAGWCAAVSCLLCSVFMKFPWYSSPDPPSEVAKLLAAFFDRILWSFFLAWVTSTCSTGRGGAFGWFLSWQVFVPLSKLTYGVYLIHYPFLMVMLHASRERLYFSHFTQVSLFFSLFTWAFLLGYLQFLACEGPVTAVNKLVFGRLARREKAEIEKQPSLQDAGGPTTAAVGAVGGRVPSLSARL